MNFKKYVSLSVSALLLVSSLGVVSFADTNAYSVKSEVNNGKTVEIFRINESEKLTKKDEEAFIRQLEEKDAMKMEKKISKIEEKVKKIKDLKENASVKSSDIDSGDVSTKSLVFYNHVSKKSVTASKANGLAKTYTYAYCNWYYSNAYFKGNIDTSGYQRATWSGSGSADMMVLNQSYTINGSALTISWPPALNNSGSTASWQSRPMNNVKSAYADHEDVYAYSYIAIYSFISSDSSDIYFGSTIYRPATYIKLT